MIRVLRSFPTARGKDTIQSTGIPFGKCSMPVLSHGFLSFNPGNEVE